MSIVLGHARRTVTDRAFAALIDGGIPTYILENLSAGVAESGRNDIAFVMQSQLLPSGPLGSYRHPLWAYGYLKEMKVKTRR